MSSREQNIRRAVLTINNPAGVCADCLDNLAFRLREGAELIIQDMSGNVIARILGRGVTRA
jgi:hypothetical protein